MKNKSALTVILGIILIIALTIIGASYFFTKNTSAPTPSATITPTPAASPETNPYPEVTSITFPIKDTTAETAVFDGQNGQHNGVDFVVPAGTEVQATAAGKVRTVGVLAPFWYRIVIDHNINGQLVTTMYGNLNPDSIKVKAGDTVEAGQVLALTEDLSPDMSHLHYEVRILGTNIQPLEWLNKNSF